MARAISILILMFLGIYRYMVFGSPSVGFLPTGRNKFEGRVMVEYGNGTKLPVCSLGVTQNVADMLCSMIGYSGATKIYSRAKCFEDSDKYDGSMVSMATCDNSTDIASCFRLAADCECCLSGNQLALRCYGEGAIELENNSGTKNKDVVTEGLVTVYTNESWWTINGKSSGSIRCYICANIGLVNYDFCKTTLSPDYYLRYGNISIPRVGPFTWNCPFSGSGTLDNCTRTELKRNKDPYLLTMKCQLPADNRLPNYTLCYDTQATGRGSAQKQLKYTLSIGGVLIVVAAVFAIAFVRTKRRNRSPIHHDEDNAMLELEARRC